ncbi:uncharacterized protein LOC108631633 isoform X2 [Ceratina calcarata]|uniref:Uncharacterized protein LOC108631633 isoform X2 n=1 Tax=Ceratina calcarata TaxID=156304 RepID=A0AAJ7JF69_9HYME|nr:uncharacterized protein LOC108631633 isoform X2 [Ceratina calcarata]
MALISLVYVFVHTNFCYPCASVTSTPLSHTSSLKKRLLDKIAGNSYNGSVDNVSSNATFETLEALCNKLYPNKLRKSLSEPSLLDMSQIRNTCEQQLASLNNSSVSHKENMQDVSSQSSDKLEFNCTKLNEMNDKSASTSYDNTSCSVKTYRKVDNNTNRYTMVDPDELEKTLYQDIVEKRKRCLDTARLIAEINVDSEAIEAQRSSPMSFAEKNPLNNEESKFLQTLMSCKNYRMYLEERKPFFKLLRNSNPSTPENSIKKAERCEDVKDLKNKTPGIEENDKQSRGVEAKNEFKKPKYFRTPGKTPPSKEFRQKKKYFHSPVKENIPEEHILKSPHAKGLYRLNYTTVLSPVAMYIRGTDTRLIQNVRPKANYDSLAPQRNIKASPSGSLKLNTPRRGIDRSQQETLPKFNLSPKIASCNKQVLAEKNLEYESPSDHFMLPKVSYKRPLYVRTIKESTTPKQGHRVKKLLENVESKVVIRHEGRINSAQKGKSTATEINYASEDESIHIETRANRNF